MRCASCVRTLRLALLPRFGVGLDAGHLTGIRQQARQRTGPKSAASEPSTACRGGGEAAVRGLGGLIQ
jgi:hypothetical protein